ncbi:MAG: signal peptidase II [Oscillospiraceae bacterium]
MVVLAHGFMGILVILDQLIKMWCLRVLRPVESINLIDGFLALTYVENRGAAFGMLSGKQTLLIIVTVCIIIGMEYYMLKVKPKDKWVLLSLSMIIAGGAGNLVDRVLRGFVVDYIDINQWFSYPMFNMADCLVVVGEIILLSALFYSEYKTAKVKKLNSENESDNNERGK